jgi:hypothetical protein
VFSSFLVTLDYPARKLSLSQLPARPGEAETAAKLGEESDDADGVAATRVAYDRYVSPEMKDYTPVYRRGHMLMLPVSLNHSRLKLFILDTGAWATSISPTVARELTKVHGDDDLHVKGLSGEVKRSYVADKVTFTFARVSQQIEGVAAFDTSSLGQDLGLEIAGFLGARTLEQTTIHIDYRDGLVKLDFDPKRLNTLR